MQQLRDYQARAVQSVNAAFSDGAQSVLLVLPTGAGKTTVGSELCRGRGRVLWVAHRRELLDQGAARLQSFGVSDPIVVSAQSLLRGDVPECDFAVIDECHHFPKENEWARVAATLRDRGTQILGLTATPQRADGVGLGSTFQRLIVGAQPRDLVAAGHLCPVDVFCPPTAQRGLASSPREAWEQFADGRRVVVFCRSVKDAESERDAWGAGEVIHGKLGAKERAARLAKPWRVLFNVFVLTEGWDQPDVKCAIIARGCGSVGTYLQIAGRILRPDPSYASAVLIDLVGVSRDHGHPCDDREYTLDGEGIRTAGASAAYAFCASCSALISDASSECERCGYRRENVFARRARIEAAKLEKLEENAAQTEATRVRRLAEWMRRAKNAGYKKGWAAWRFNGVYRRWPNRDEIEKASRYAF